MKSLLLLGAIFLSKASLAQPYSDLKNLSEYVNPLAATYFNQGEQEGWEKVVTVGEAIRYSSGNEVILIGRDTGGGKRVLSGADTAKATRWAASTESGAVKSFSVCDKESCLNASAGSCHALYNLVNKMGETALANSAKTCGELAGAVNDSSAKAASKKDSLVMMPTWSVMKGKVDHYPMQEANVAIALAQIPKLWEICKKVAFYPDVETNGYSTYWKDPKTNEAKAKTADEP